MKVEIVRETKKVKIGDLFFDLGIEPVQNNLCPIEFDLKVKTPYGYKPVDCLFTTERQSRIRSYFSNGTTIETSPKHLFRTVEEEWKRAEDLKQGDRVVTERGSSTLKRQIVKKREKVLYDLTVRDVHCYYSNGVLSHNSWLCISAAAQAVKLGYNVNYYTLELGEEYVGKRFDANITGLDTEGLKKGRSKVEKTLKSLTGNLIIKEYPPKSASINTIKAHIQKCTDMGMKPDLVIIDYVDYLKSPSKVKYLERKDEIDDVFISAKALAKEMKIPVITPSQVNRGGAKDDVIEGDKAAGSYDKIMVADICLSLSRKKEDKVLGTGRLHLMKSRYGNDGLTWDVQLDTSTGTMNVLGESQAGGGTSQGGSKSYKDVASKFFSLENIK